MTSWQYGNRSDVGLVRDGNEDASYAGPRLLVVADGVGGSVAGEIASNIAITALSPLDRDDDISDPQQALREATRQANRQLREAIEADPSLAGMGTTLTALLWSGETLALAQLGDSRGYMLRNGELTQITRDQTLVQSLVDDGQITAEEALTHPRRSWILRALDGRDESDPDVELLTAQPGDRFLLCSDGLSDYVEIAAIAEALGQGEPQQASEALVDLALRAGAPDNVTCVVADPVEEAPAGQQPLLGGAATATPRIPKISEPAASEGTVPSEDGGRHAVERGPRRIGLRLAIVAGVVIVLIGAAIAITATYIHRQWYVAQSEGKVTIYQGVKGKALGYDLSHVHQVTDLPATALPYDDQSNVRNGISTSGGLAGAQLEVDTLRSDACALAASTAPRPSPSPSTVTGKRHKHHLRKAIPKPTLPSWCPTTSATATP